MKLKINYIIFTVGWQNFVKLQYPSFVVCQGFTNKGDVTQWYKGISISIIVHVVKINPQSRYCNCLG